MRHILKEYTPIISVTYRQIRVPRARVLQNFTLEYYTRLHRISALWHCCVLKRRGNIGNISCLSWTYWRNLRKYAKALLLQVHCRQVSWTERWITSRNLTRLLWRLNLRFSRLLIEIADLASFIDPILSPSSHTVWVAVSSNFPHEKWPAYSYQKSQQTETRLKIIQCATARICLNWFRLLWHRSGSTARISNCFCCGSILPTDSVVETTGPFLHMGQWLATSGNVLKLMSESIVCLIFTPPYPCLFLFSDGRSVRLCKLVPAMQEIFTNTVEVGQGSQGRICCGPRFAGQEVYEQQTSVPALTFYDAIFIFTETSRIKSRDQTTHKSQNRLIL